MGQTSHIMLLFIERALESEQFFIFCSMPGGTSVAINICPLICAPTVFTVKLANLIKV